MKLLGICGSLRAESTNIRLLRAAARLVPADVELRVSDSPSRLPLFNPDWIVNDFATVSAWARDVKAADGIIVSTPEYARGYPGALKNAFDWLVATDAHVDKPFMMLNATARSTIARDTFIRVLETMSGIHIESASATIPLLGTKVDVDGILENREFADRIRGALEAFVSALRTRAAAHINR